MVLSVGGEQVLVMMQERRTKLYFHRVGTFSIGRSEQCALVLKESFISLFHAELCSADGALLLKDLGSTNGTYVNERRAGQVQLKAGDVVDLLAMRMIIGAGFVAADRPLPLSRYVPAALPDVPPNAELCVKWLSSPLSVRTMELPPLPQLSPPAFQPLALQLGAGMTMALFSLLAYSRSSSGMWMAWGMACASQTDPGEASAVREADRKPAAGGACACAGAAGERRMLEACADAAADAVDGGKDTMAHGRHSGHACHHLGAQRG